MYALSPVLTHWSPSPVASISRFRHLYLYPYRCTRLGLGLYHPFYPRSPGECGLLRARWRRQQTPCIVVTLGGEYRRRFRYLAGVPGGAATRVLALLRVGESSRAPESATSGGFTAPHRSGIPSNLFLPDHHHLERRALSWRPGCHRRFNKRRLAHQLQDASYMRILIET